MYFANIYVVTLLLICSQLKESWARSLSMSWSLSLTLNDDEHLHPTLEMLRSCMKETQLSMSDLKSDRTGVDSSTADPPSDLEKSSLDSEADAEPIEATDYRVAGDEPMHYDDVSGMQGDRSSKTQPNESLHCFRHCLNERFGVYKNGLNDKELLRKLAMSVQSEESILQECMDRNSVNKCEATNKVHQCINKLKSLDAERRLVHIVKFSEFSVIAVDPENYDRDTLGDNVIADSKSNEVEDA